MDIIGLVGCKLMMEAAALYIVPLLFMWGYAVWSERGDIHSAWDFVFPFERDMNLIIWCPLVNAVYMVLVILWMAIEGAMWIIERIE